MKRLLTFLCLCAGLTAQGREISNTNGLPRPRPVYRYLFLVDTSSAMARQKNVTLDTLSKLIAGGVGGHIHTGEFWNIWTFDDQLHTNVFQAQMWNLAPQNDAANRAARLLRNQTFKNKKGRLAGPMAAIADEATLSGALTVVLFTDGSEPLNGTPFDQDINDIFTRHAAGMRKAKKPFVIALVAQDGKFVAHAVTPGGEPPHIPQPPKRPAPDPSPENEGAALRTPTQAGTNPKATAAETAPAGPTPPPKALTIEEIEETLRQSRITQPKTAAPAPAPLIIAAPNSSESNQSSNTTARPALFETTSPLSPDKISPHSVPGTDSKVPPASAPPALASIEPGANSPTNIPIAVPMILPPARQTNQDTIATVGTPSQPSAESSLSPPAPPQAATLVQPAPTSNSGKYLAGAAVLLMAAFVLTWLYIRSIRYVPRPSAISRSVEEEQRKSD